jgi:hypothetical protein
MLPGRLRRRVVAVLLLSWIVLFGVVARADEPASSDLARAAELKKQGDDLMVSLQYRDALDAYAKSYSINPDPAVLYNRARAHQALAEYPEALDLLATFSQTAPADLKARVPFLKELIEDIRARVATLEVRADVPSARLFVRDKLESTLPATQPIRVRAGMAKIEVRADGYVPFVKEVELPGGKTTTLEAKMLKDVPDGRAVLSITSSQSSAVVTVDGRPLGTAPVETVLAAGRHAVVVQSEGHEDSHIDVELASGQRRSMDVTLTPKRSILAKWWFWTGVGVVVATGVVIIIAANTTSEAPSGTIPPGQVRGPLTIDF